MVRSYTIKKKKCKPLKISSSAHILLTLLILSCGSGSNCNYCKRKQLLIHKERKSVRSRMCALAVKRKKKITINRLWKMSLLALTCDHVPTHFPAIDDLLFSNRQWKESIGRPKGAHNQRLERKQSYRAPCRPYRWIPKEVAMRWSASWLSLFSFHWGSK